MVAAGGDGWDLGRKEEGRWAATHSAAAGVGERTGTDRWVGPDLRISLRLSRERVDGIAIWSHQHNSGEPNTMVGRKSDSSRVDPTRRTRD